MNGVRKSVDMTANTLGGVVTGATNTATGLAAGGLKNMQNVTQGVTEIVFGDQSPKREAARSDQEVVATPLDDSVKAEETDDTVEHAETEVTDKVSRCNSSS